jgi:hypothetical protein
MRRSEGTGDFTNPSLTAARPTNAPMNLADQWALHASASVEGSSPYLTLAEQVASSMNFDGMLGRPPPFASLVSSSRQ